MGIIDLIVIVLVLAFALSRFMGFKLPKDPRKPGERRMDWDKLRETFGGQPDDAKRGPKDVTPATGVKDAAKAPTREMATRTRPAKAAKRPSLEGLSGLEQIKALDEGFDEERFKEGVGAAYQFFYTCWNDRDEVGLDQLCGPELMATLRDNLAAYAARGVKPWVSDISVTGVEIGEARVVGRSAVVTAEITAKQREGETRLAGEVAGKGSKAAKEAPAHTVRVRWVLARPLASEDPNWELQQIEQLGGRA